MRRKGKETAKISHCTIKIGYTVGSVSSTELLKLKDDRFNVELQEILKIIDKIKNSI